MSRKLTVALDVDGVVCPVMHPDDLQKVEARTGWGHAVLPHPVDRFVIADPVWRTLVELDAACAVSGAGAVEGTELSVLWHTSWWREAEEVLAPALGLASLSKNAMFATDEEHDGGHSSLGHWWKLVAVKRWLDEHRGTDDLLIWVDDDIDHAVKSGEIDEALISDPHLALISPTTYRGLNAAELARLRALTGLRPLTEKSQP